MTKHALHVNILFFLISLLFGLVSCQEERAKHLPILGNYDLNYRVQDGKTITDTIYQVIPNFQFLNEDSILVTKDTYKGKVWISEFFFATCPSICPIMNTQLKNVEKALQRYSKDLQFLSFTIDPKHDTPSILKAHKQKLGIQNRVDIVNGTLGKAYGVTGGYIAADRDVIDSIRSVASGFIFTTSISPVICAGALASIKYTKDYNELRIQHQDVAAKFKRKLQEAGIEVLDNSCTHIVPVMVRDAKLCKQISDELLDEHGIYVQAINYPTVAVGAERLRFAPTPLHTDAMIDDCIRGLINCLKD